MKESTASFKNDQLDGKKQKKRKSVYGTEVSSRVPNFLVPLLILDKKVSSYLSVCAGKDSTFASFRNHMKVIEITGHGYPWLAGCLGLLITFRDSWAQGILINIFVALLLDIAFVGLLKAITRRSRPSNNDMDMFATFSVDGYSFPSGHASRAVMMLFILISKCNISPYLFSVLTFWTLFVCISRVLLGRHHAGDVIVGMLLGFVEFKIMDLIWMSPETAYSFLWLFYDYDTTEP